MKEKNRFKSVVILAAGNSSRMKTLKALLPFSKKITFIEQLISVYSELGCSEIVVIINPELAITMESLAVFPPQVSFILNRHPKFERFYSVKIGLKHIHKASYCFLQNIDNPFIDRNILDAIYEQRTEEAYISPQLNGKGGHPILLNQISIDYIRNYPVNDANLRHVLSELPVKEFELNDPRILININDPSEYQKQLRHL